MLEVVQIIWAISIIVIAIITACVQLYDQKHRNKQKKATSLTDTRRAKEDALREAASQSLRLNLMAMDAAHKMSEAAARHTKSGSWS